MLIIIIDFEFLKYLNGFTMYYQYSILPDYSLSNKTSNENARPIPITGIKSHSDSCQALVPSWKQKTTSEEKPALQAPNITYPSGSRG